ncbi:MULTISPECIES: tRNA pseudouridine(55) synthase TruB [Corynebacterium]|uniref:tRNA pseudouridine synthase B n=1 Tax=Corynebacterium lipophilum TaxID=2804918 RepID=A0AAW5HTM0_9CORY|nr:MULTISPECIES: tRNA pseudouridine(55) synthase TruB [Corynebacterium]MCO6393524.1 tRNA pseudouridine(55) synthase TruB [Corynebacterium lipophilum]MCQ4607717.1 tRNA pseudouridine(55) synthase TruB [Corynebacterium pseudogenitalium]MCZ2116778.1 tRNA pseudouridine(55) synthase TruB [Corynebacterium lipophilum]UUA86488.1 tRNA pseudouridine(55) synthase TruB [Corynebacterium pseudogenitalium]
MSDPLATSGIVVIDKPQGLTSHDVVARLRRAFGTRKVGHAGTLDPMATGVLVVGIERGTKLLAHLVAETKTYEATIRLGATTTTDDAEGEVVSTSPTDAVTDADIIDAIDSFRGDIMQRPSSVSAIKIDGKRAHQLVREGHDVEIPARPVTIHEYSILGIARVDTWIDVDVRVHCSSGTYIRALARDLGETLHTGGHLTALRRTTVGPFNLEHALELEDIQAHPRFSLTLDEACATCWPVLPVTNDEYDALAMGKWLEPRGLSGVHAAQRDDGRVVALVKESKKRLATVFVARPSTL